MVILLNIRKTNIDYLYIWKAFMDEINNIREPQQQRAIETKEKLKKAALKMFSKKGYHKTNSKDIAKEAGVAVGSFYAYYKDKKELFIDILEEHFRFQDELIIEKANEIKASGNFSIEKKKEFLRFIVKNIFDVHDMSPEFHRETSALIYSDPDVKKIKDTHEKNGYEYSEKLLNLFKDNLKVKDVKIASFLICRVVEDIVHSIKFDDAPIKGDKLLDELVEMIYKYLFL